MLTPIGFGVTYFAFPLLFFLFFMMVGVTAVVTRLRARRPQPPVPPVERVGAVVRKKHILEGIHRRYQAIFLIETNREKAFLLTRTQYEVLRRGMRGVLVHKGTHFLCFEQQETQRM